MRYLLVTDPSPRQTDLTGPREIGPPWKTPAGRRALVWLGVGLVLLLVGVALGAGMTRSKKVTVTDTLIRTRTSFATTTVVKHLVRTRTRTRVVNHTVTQAAPPVQGFDYGQFAGDFRVQGISVHTDEIGVTHITGQISYTGGLGCDPSYVEISATFFDANHNVVDTGLSNFTSMSPGSWYPFDASTSGSPAVSSATAVISQANC